MKELQKVFRFLSSLLSTNFQSPQIKRLVGRRKDRNLESIDVITKGGVRMKFTSRQVTADSSSQEDLAKAVNQITQSFGKDWSVRVKRVQSDKAMYIVNALSGNHSEWVEVIVKGSDSK